jgi:hypothetical protein
LELGILVKYLVEASKGSEWRRDCTQARISVSQKYTIIWVKIMKETAGILAARNQMVTKMNIGISYKNVDNGHQHNKPTH